MNKWQSVICLVALVVAVCLFFFPPHRLVPATPTTIDGMTLNDGYIVQVDNGQLALRLGFVAVAALVLCLIAQTRRSSSVAMDGAERHLNVSGRTEETEAPSQSPAPVYVRFRQEETTNPKKRT